MKNIIIITLIVICSVVKADTKTFIKALIMTESSGRSYVTGDNGKAVGCLQIHPCVVKDVNRIYKTHYKLSDRKNIKKSIEMCIKYLKHYGAHYTKKTGLRPTHQVYSRIWNGGVYGWKNKATEKYWDKVKYHIAKINTYNVLKTKKYMVCFNML